MIKILKYEISKNMNCINQESFWLPDCLNKFFISVDMPEECRYMAFVLIKDPIGKIRLQKLLGYGEQILGIGLKPEDTSIGGVPGTIIGGQWEITFGIFSEYVEQKLKDESIPVLIEITKEEKSLTEVLDYSWVDESLGHTISKEKYNWSKVYQNKNKWYKGDFHTHTTLSDGKETIRNAMKKAKQMKLDFYVPTEHNLMHTGWCDTDTLVVPGIEITTDLGHFNLFGITASPTHLIDLVKNNKTSSLVGYVVKTIEEATKNKWILSINHPFLTIWSWKYDDLPLEKVQCIEIINDPTYPDAKESNDKAIHFIDMLWQEGYQIFGVGGSDSHNLIEERYENATTPSIAGDPGTYVYCDSLTPVNLLNAVRAGHICVTRFCHVVPEIIVEGTSYLPGDRVDIDGVISYTLRINDCSDPPDVFFVKNGNYIPVPVTSDEDSYIANVNFEFLEEWNWARMEVRRKNGDFLAYTNPIYRGTKEKRFITFGEVKRNLEK